MPFQKRIYSPKLFFTDLKVLLQNRRAVKQAMSVTILERDLVEKIMLAVTSVNRCRYCSAFHSKLARKQGICVDEIDRILVGDLSASREDEHAALFFAEQWALAGGEPDQCEREKLVHAYGEEKALAITLACHMIRMGNLSGNTLDFIIYNLTLGRFGNE